MDIIGCENMKTSDYSYVFVIFSLFFFIIFFLHKFIVECKLKAKKIVLTILKRNNHTSSVTVAEHIWRLAFIRSMICIWTYS